MKKFMENKTTVTISLENFKEYERLQDLSKLINSKANKSILYKIHDWI